MGEGLGSARPALHTPEFSTTLTSMFAPASRCPFSLHRPRAVHIKGVKYMRYTTAAAATRRFGFMTTVSTVALIAASATAQAQTAQTAQSPAVEEIVVTGSRVVRDGYEAPTPVTVIGLEQMEAQPMQHISDFVNRLPAFGGAQTTTSGGNEISTGRQSQNNLNLRSLDSYRTLVLLDGNRIVTGDVNGSVNASDLPTPLISRVDVVTGGASAAYGSDAVAGVVNFVLDKEFVGLKGEIQGGITNYGDDPSYKVTLTGGTSFANGRGHLLFSGEHAWNKGIYGASKSRGDFWSYDTGHLIENPAWGTGAGQSPTNPRWLVRSQAATLLATPGGIITAGPLKGTAFNPDGTPRTYTYGSLTNAQFTVGGDWKYSDATYYNQTLSNKVSRQAFFVRGSYDLTDDITGYINLLNTSSYGFARSKLDDKLGNITIKADNPYLNESVRSQMTALKLTTFTMGSFLLDIPYITTDNYRNLWSYSGGLNGKLEAFGTNWTWDVHAQYGLVRSDLNGRVVNNTNFANAVDSVRDANNRIVCRSTLTAPTNGCVPFNPFGSGNNDVSAIAYVKQTAVLYQRNTESTFSAGLSGGEPFDTWAGPVSVATGFEWRREAVTPGNISAYCPLCLTSSYTAGNYKGTNGSYSVAEGYVEVVAPLAKDTVWAKSLDLNAAVRATGYSTSGYVTTWKAGLTYNPLDELRFRATRSRDIRAPNLGDLYNGGGGGQSPGLIDPSRPGAPPVTYLNSTSGNPALQPEKADTTGLGVVLQPAFFPGFSSSVDFYDINIKGAIDTIGGQEILDRCFAGQTTQCGAVQRNPLVAGDPYSVGTIRIIDVKPFNLTSLHQRGYDFEASYQTKLDQINEGWGGDVSLRAIGTYIQYFKRNDGRNPEIDAAGTNAGQGPLKWRWMFSGNYTNDALSITWTGRFMSSGRYGGTATSYVQCAAGSCPVSTTSFPTIDNNYIESRFYHDLSLTYKLTEGEGISTSLYLNVSNLMNTAPPFIVSTNYWYMTVNPQMYDTIGRRFYGGVRFKM